MLTKIVLAAALAIGTAGAAMASNENDGGNETGGYRELGPGGVVTNGVNPVFHRSLRAGASRAYGYSAYGYAPGFAPEHTTHTKHTTK
jgi:ABC-type sugar transport system substrate-binding protein